MSRLDIKEMKVKECIDISKKLNIVKIKSSELLGLKLVNNGDLGSTSRVYHYGENECIKIFNHNMDSFDLYRMNELTNLSIEGANLPKKLVLLRNKFRAYIMDYINGVMLSQLEEMNFDEVLALFTTLIDTSDNLGEEKIRIYDVHDDNIMYNYDKKILELIDPVEWNRCMKSTKVIKEENFKMINIALRTYLFFGSNYLLPILVDYDFPELKRTDDYIDYYQTLKENLERKTSSKIKTIDDSRKSMQGVFYGI